MPVTLYAKHRPLTLVIGLEIQEKEELYMVSKKTHTTKRLNFIVCKKHNPL